MKDMSEEEIAEVQELTKQRKSEAMRKIDKAIVATIVVLLLACAGCASNPDAAGQALSGVLMGIGQGLSGL